MKYLALTIGPIYKTLAYARKTRELWATSYLFSRLMELLKEKIEEGGGKIIQPQRPAVSPEQLYGAGIYPDRLFANATELGNEKIEAAIKNAVVQLASEILPSHFQNSRDEYEFWKNYLRIGWLTKPVENPSGDNLFKTFRPYLDTLELQEPYFAREPSQDYLLEFLNAIYNTKISGVLKGSARGKYQGLMTNLFPSTADIATFELFHLDNSAYRKLWQSAIEATKTEDEDDDKVIRQFYRLLYAKESPFKTSASDYHKYFCILHADGDSFGDTISNLKDENAFHKFSEEITQYGSKAAELINQHGGKPVFIGGDDLLIFAPVVTEKGSVFKLVRALDKMFKEIKLDPQPTLSFGLTITYYKFPLFEARSLSYDQLTHRAKKFKANSDEKNAVAFRLLKHSGSYFEAVLTKAQLGLFIETEDKLRNADKNLLSSVIYKLDTLEKLFSQLFVKGQLTSERLENLFYNFFNERIHRQHEDHMALIRKLVLAIYTQKATVDNKALNPADNLYAVLRLLKFITDKPA